MFFRVSHNDPGIETGQTSLNSGAEHSHLGSRPVVPSRINLEHDLDDWKDDLDEQDHAPSDDVERYLRWTYSDEETNSSCCTVDCENTFNVAKFWSSVQVRRDYPLPSRVALGVLSIPASSACSERVFSTAGRVVEKRRTRLSANSIDNLLFLHSKLVADEL